MSRTGRASWRGFPLGAQRRGVRERKDVAGEGRDVRVVGKPGITRRDRDDVRESNTLGDERDGRCRAAVAKATALIAALRRRVRAAGRVMLGGGDLLDGRPVTAM